MARRPGSHRSTRSSRSGSMMRSSQTILPGDVVHVEREASGLRVAAEGIREMGQRVVIEATGLTRLRTGRIDRTYQGAFEIRASGGSLQIVNRVPMEPYVASVVASEYPFSEIEGVKAQAVSPARTRSATAATTRTTTWRTASARRCTRARAWPPRPRGRPRARRRAKCSTTEARSSRPSTARPLAGTPPTTRPSGAPPRSPISAGAPTRTTKARPTTSGPRRPTPPGCTAR